MNDYVIVVNGLDNLDDIDNLDENIVKAARQAINRVTDRTRTRSDKQIREEVNFPPRYLAQRLTVSQRASGNNLQATISGRDRPTSLARFTKDRNPAAARRRGGVTVTVSPGQSVFMAGAFLMQLRGGNLGLALRLKAGESIRNKRSVRKVGAGLYLLYGPSINQVFATVAQDQTPEAAEELEREFLRLLDL